MGGSRLAVARPDVDEAPSAAARTVTPQLRARQLRTGRPAARGALSALSAERLVLAAAVVAGVAERWWAGTHSIGTLTSDGGVIGLMGIQLLHHGRTTAYMWGQAYGGSLEAALTAAVFALAGVGTGQLLATTALTSALVALALWRAGRRVVGEAAARLGALVWWVLPATYVWRALKPGGTYMAGLALSLCAVGALARIRSGERSWKMAALAGLFAGLAAWSSPMSLQLLVPAAIWALRDILRLGRRMAAVVAGAIVGSVPAIWFGLRHGWANLRVPGRHHLFVGYVSRFLQFFRVEVPLALSLRLDGSLAWRLGWAGPALALGAELGFVAVLVAAVSKRSSRCVLPVLTLAVLPLLFAFNVLARHVGQSRYVEFGMTMGMLLVGVGLENASRAAARWWRRSGRGRSLAVGLGGRRWARSAAAIATWSAGLALLAALGFSTLTAEPASALVGLPAGGVAMPTNDGALLSLLAEHHVHDAYAPYWVAYRVMFETRGASDVAPYTNDRYPPLGRKVALSADPSYLFVSSSPSLPAFLHWCEEHGMRLHVWRRGDFAVVRPDHRLLEGEVPQAVLRPGRRHLGGGLAGRFHESAGH